MVEAYKFFYLYMLIRFWFYQTAQTRVETWDDKTQQASFIAMLEALSFTIDRVACEVITKN